MYTGLLLSSICLSVRPSQDNKFLCILDYSCPPSVCQSVHPKTTSFYVYWINLVLHLFVSPSIPRQQVFMYTGLLLSSICLSVHPSQDNKFLCILDYSCSSSVCQSVHPKTTSFYVYWITLVLHLFVSSSIPRQQVFMYTGLLLSSICLSVHPSQDNKFLCILDYSCPPSVFQSVHPKTTNFYVYWITPVLHLFVSSSIPRQVFMYTGLLLSSICLSVHPSQDNKFLCILDFSCPSSVCQSVHPKTTSFYVYWITLVLHLFVSPSILRQQVFMYTGLLLSSICLSVHPSQDNKFLCILDYSCPPSVCQSVHPKTTSFYVYWITLALHLFVSPSIPRQQVFMHTGLFLSSIYLSVRPSQDNKFLCILDYSYPPSVCQFIHPKTTSFYVYWITLALHLFVSPSIPRQQVFMYTGLLLSSICLSVRPSQDNKFLCILDYSCPPSVCQFIHPKTTSFYVYWITLVLHLFVSPSILRQQVFMYTGLLFSSICLSVRPS